MKVTSDQNTNSKDGKEAGLKTLYARSVINSFSSGMVNPFTGYFAVNLGASSSEMGWFQSSSNLSNNVMQVLWGRLSDRLKRRIPFILLGGLIVSVLWIPMFFVTTPVQLIALLALQALLGSMATPAWTALIGDLVHPSKFGRVNASINLWASFGGLGATLIAGTLMVVFSGSLQTMFFIPIIAATVFGIAAALVMLTLKEKKNGERLNIRDHMRSDLLGMAARVRQSPDFLRYCYVDGTYQFFMSFAWPLISITQVKVLHASPFDLAVLSIVQTTATIAFQGWAGRLADSFGRKPLLVYFRLAFVTVPLAYALVPNMTLLIVISTFWGFSQALGSAAQTTYLLDVSPEEQRGSFIAMYNMVVGVVTFFGSLIAGYLSDYMIGIFGLFLGLLTIYVISTVGRGMGTVLHVTLKETLKR